MDRRKDIDFIKGIAIIAVILYHVGLLPYGFLGVDCFFAISGFLIIPKLCRNIHDGKFNYIVWLSHRLYRIWPITLVASIVCLITGYFVMIPDAYENLAESVVASNIFANNILAAITTRNYWDASNEFKPLMQMWYLGVVAQLFVVFPVILLALSRCIALFYKKAGNLLVSLSLIGLISFVLYIMPGVLFAEKFYVVQYRIWEFAAGGIIGVMSAQPVTLRIAGYINTKYISIFALILLCVIFCIGLTSISAINNVTIIGEETIATGNHLKMALTVIVVMLTCVMLYNKLNINMLIGALGERH